MTPRRAVLLRSVASGRAPLRSATRDRVAATRRAVPGEIYFLKNVSSTIFGSRRSRALYCRILHASRLIVDVTRKRHAGSMKSVGQRFTNNGHHSSRFSTRFSASQQFSSLVMFPTLDLAKVKFGHLHAM